MILKYCPFSSVFKYISTFYSLVIVLASVALTQWVYVRRTYRIKYCVINNTYV
jgi:hypothetical protein